ncbi:hypothetical protein ACEPAF_8639 [Sanghuangporus sanghuang]
MHIPLVIRIEDISKKAKKSSTLYVEVKLGKIIRKTVTLDGDGKPAWKGTLAFSLSDTSAVLTIQLKENRKLEPTNLLGHVGIKSEELLQETGRDFQRSLSSPPSRLFPQRRTESSGIIHLHLEKIDALRSAEIEVDIAEHGVETIKNRLDRHLPVVETIGLLVEAGDKIFDAIDKAPGMTSIVTLSWKSSSALFKLVSDQYKGDKDLIGLAERMKTAFEFSDELSGSLDRREDLKPRLQRMLHETVECSRFVQEYSRHSFPSRMVLGHKRQKIKDYKDRFVDLRRDLDTAMLKKIVSQHDLTDLKEKLGPFTTMSDVSKRPRCLPGTRTKYLGQISGFLKSKTSPNILWITGAAGSGKSTIAVTASFGHGYDTVHLFFERNKSEPSNVIRTIACKLAERHPLVGKHIIRMVGESMNIIDGAQEEQFTKLLLEPLNKVDIPNTIVIILDALDECGNADSRRALLNLLKTKFALLPSKVRILITSRPERDIMKDLATKTQINHVELAHATEDGTNDVALYIREEMENEFGDEVQKLAKEIQVLCKAADGLFIWASTAVRMVRSPIDPRQNLQKLVENIRRLGEHGLDSLYATALKGTGIWQSYSKDEGTAVLGLILAAKESMTGAVIAAFLGLEEETVDPILRQLQSLVSYEPGKPVRLHHASFADYLLSSDRSGKEPWHIDEVRQKQVVTERCFEIMAKNLRFNICNLTSSFILNEDVPGLQTRIANNIRPQLDYACRFWAVHMCELSNSDVSTELKDRMKTFGNEHLLYWLEVLSLTGKFNRVAIRALYDASMWSAPVDEEIYSLFWAAYRLTSVFAYPISQSAPQIYLSAISLWKGESLIADRYSGTHPVVKVNRLGIRTPSQCIKVLNGHTGPVTSIAVSPDGERIVSSAYDKTIRVWSAFSGGLISGPFEMDSTIYSVSFSADGEQVVSGSIKAICIWDADTGNLVSGPLKIGNSEVTSVAFSQDGKRVISVSNGKVSYSENGDAVPAQFEDVRIQVVSPDGKYVIGFKDTKIGIWDTGTGKRVSALFNVGDVTSIVVSPDGKRLATEHAGALRIWDVDSGALVKEFESFDVRYVFSIAFSPDGKRVVSGGDEIVVWDIDCTTTSGQRIFCQGHTSFITSAIFTPDGKRVISGSKDSSIRIWDVGGLVGLGGSTEIVSRAFEAHTEVVKSVAFSPDGKRIVSGSWDKSLRIWDADDGKHLVGPFKGHTDSVHSVTFMPDGKRVISSSWDSTIRIWDADSGELILGPLEGHTDSVRLVAVSTDGKRIVSGSYDGRICIWDADSGILLSGPLKGHTGRVNSVAFSPDGERVVSGSSHATVCLWNADSGELVLGPLRGHTREVLSVAFSPDERIASGSADATIRVWDAGTGELISGPLEGHSERVSFVVFSPNGRCLVSGSWDKTIRVWDAKTGKLTLGPLEGHSGRIYSVAISPDGMRVVSGSDDKTIRVWDMSGEGIVPGRGGKLAEGALTTSSSSSRADTHTGPNDQGTDSLASGARTVSDWMLTEDGWVKGEEGELLTWIPEDMRDTLCRARNTAVFSCKFSTKLDLLNSPLGENWAKGYPK